MNASILMALADPTVSQITSLQLVGEHSGELNPLYRYKRLQMLDLTKARPRELACAWLPTLPPSVQVLKVPAYFDAFDQGQLQAWLQTKRREELELKVLHFEHLVRGPASVQLERECDRLGITMSWNID